MSDLTWNPVHICDSTCWPTMVRYGADDMPCDPFEARAASEAAAAAEGAFAFSHEY